MRLLIVDDEKTLTTVLQKKLSADFSVDVANDGAHGSFMACTNEYDLAILDYHLPRRHGKDICRDIREKGKSYPILMLSVEKDSQAKTEALNLGADDFISKPFSYAELEARIKAMLRRPKSITNTTLNIADLYLNPATNEVTRNGKGIYLTKKEFMLLEYFMRNENLVLSRGMLMEHVWDINGDIFSNTIEMHIANLRKKIDSKNRVKLIHTVSGRGYKLAIKK